MRFIVKPVAWSDTNYNGPSGRKYTSGYPKEHGYGHEDWNNSSFLRETLNHRQYRYFHTEKPKSAFQNDEDLCLILIASGNSQQQLVSVALNPEWLGEDNLKPVRTQIAARLRLNERLYEEAWNTETVKRAHGHDKAKFRVAWLEEFHWIPNWRILEENFLQLDAPISLNAKAISGSEKLTNMFSGSQSLSDIEALKLFDQTRSNSQIYHSKLIQNIIFIITARSQTEEINFELLSNAELSNATRRALINIRVGQEKFRKEVLSEWQNKCAVTGWSQPELIRASHIIPWAKCNRKQKVNKHNGIPLAAHLDAAFDRGLLTFGTDGRLIVSELLEQNVRRSLKNLTGLSRKQNPEMEAFLQYHRRHIFRSL